MEKTNPKYAAYLEILEEELVPAMGCTEPIAIAFAAAKGRALLGALPVQQHLAVVLQIDDIGVVVGDANLNRVSALAQGKADVKYQVAVEKFHPDGAGSDARMGGCELPVIINSGSGNQGITASVPVIVYGRGLGVSEEKLFRALTLSNLITIHQKTRIGRLSAYLVAAAGVDDNRQLTAPHPGVGPGGGSGLGLGNEVVRRGGGLDHLGAVGSARGGGRGGRPHRPLPAHYGGYL